MFVQDISSVLNPLIHSFTISANEVDATDSIGSHRGRPPVAAMEGHVTGNQLISRLVYRSRAATPPQEVA